MKRGYHNFIRNLQLNCFSLDINIIDVAHDNAVQVYSKTSLYDTWHGKRSICMCMVAIEYL